MQIELKKKLEKYLEIKAKADAGMYALEDAYLLTTAEIKQDYKLAYEIFSRWSAKNRVCYFGEMSLGPYELDPKVGRLKQIKRDLTYFESFESVGGIFIEVTKSLESIEEADLEGLINSGCLAAKAEKGKRELFAFTGEEDNLAKFLQGDEAEGFSELNLELAYEFISPIAGIKLLLEAEQALDDEAIEVLNYIRNWVVLSGNCLKDPVIQSFVVSSAKEGYLASSVSLALMCKAGWAMGSDWAKVILIPAMKGEPVSQMLLAEAYYEGTVVEQDYKESEKWAIKAVKKGVARASTLLGKMHYKGLLGEANFVLARAFFEQALEKKDLNANLWLSEMLMKGEGGNVNPERARVLLEQAANRDIADAQEKLGICRFTGQFGYSISFASARFWLEKAIKNGSGSSEVRHYLGIIYHSGLEVEQNDRKARQLFTEAIQMGSSVSEQYLGMMYLNGDGVRRSYVRAQELLGSSFAQGTQSAKPGLEEIQTKKAKFSARFKKLTADLNRAEEEGSKENSPEKANKKRKKGF